MGIHAYIVTVHRNAEIFLLILSFSQTQDKSIICSNLIFSLSLRTQQTVWARHGFIVWQNKSNWNTPMSMFPHSPELLSKNREGSWSRGSSGYLHSSSLQKTAVNHLEGKGTMVLLGGLYWGKARCLQSDSSLDNPTNLGQKKRKTGRVTQKRERGREGGRKKKQKARS